MEEGRDFDSGPFDPGVETGGEFDDFGDVGSADAGCRFKEIECAVGLPIVDNLVVCGSEVTASVAVAVISGNNSFVDNFHI